MPTTASSLLLISAVLIMSGNAQGQEKTTTLKACLDAKDTAVSHYLRFHADPGKTEEADKTDQQVAANSAAVVITRIRENYAIRCRVPADSADYYYKTRDVYGWARQSSPGPYLGKKRLSKLIAALSSLPKSDIDPEKGLSILVSFRDGDEWRTDIFSASAIPKELEAVMEILGERFETKTEPAHAPERRWPVFSGDVF